MKKKYHKNKKLNEVLIKLEEDSKKENYCFSKKQKKNFINKISQKGYSLVELLISLAFIGIFSYFLYLKGVK